MVKGRETEGVEVPEAVIETLNRTLSSVEHLNAELPQFLSLSDPQLLADCPLLQRAHSLFSLAKLTSTLFSVKLRCRGVNPNDHPVKSLLNKISVLQKKLECLQRWSEAQRQDIRNTSVEEGPKMNYQEQVDLKRRKYASSEEQTVVTGAIESVKTEKEELLSDNTGSIKGPIVIDISDDDD